MPIEIKEMEAPQVCSSTDFCNFRSMVHFFVIHYNNVQKTIFHKPKFPSMGLKESEYTYYSLISLLVPFLSKVFWIKDIKNKDQIYHV